MIRVELRTVQGFPWKRFGLIVIAVMVTVYTVVSIYAEVEESLEKLFANPINPTSQSSVDLQHFDADSLTSSTLLMSNIDYVTVSQFCDKVPNVARIFSLSIDAEGEYSIEGFCPVGSESGLLEALKMIRSFPTEANLSFWRQGSDPLNRYRFAIRGCMPRFLGKEFSPVVGTEAESLLARVVIHASKSGLRAIHADKVNISRLSDKLERWRTKFWAIGSRSQISVFVNSVVDGEPDGFLSELLIVPAQMEDAPTWQNSQVFATVDAVVTVSRGGHGDVL
tara:strand:+ start:2675 stop:3514 length:840 start_codon:yes stop_codon:yes gene_type:complete